MSFEDPFVVVQNEIIVSIDKTRTGYKNWLEYKEKIKEDDKEIKNEFAEKTLELRNQVRSLEWDIEDLEETFKMYDSYPKKMKLIIEQELSSREKFITETKDELKMIKNDVFDTKYDVKERNAIINLINNPMSYYSLTFDGNNASKYKRLNESTSEDNNNTLRKNDEIGINIEENGLIPQNDLRLAKEMEQMIEEENNDLNYELISDYNSDYNQVYQPTLNVIDSKYDSPLKRVARVFHIPNEISKQRLTIVGVMVLLLLFVVGPFI